MVTKLICGPVPDHVLRVRFLKVQWLASGARGHQQEGTCCHWNYSAVPSPVLFGPGAQRPSGLRIHSKVRRTYSVACVGGHRNSTMLQERSVPSSVEHRDPTVLHVERFLVEDERGD